jgi:hypothetical protein
MDIMEKTKFTFDLQQIRDEVRFYTEKYPQQQIGLTHSINATTLEERMNEATGTNVLGSLKKDADFVIFNKDFNGTLLQTMFETLSTEYRLCRFRIMTMSGPSTYYAHSDISQRLHYAVETNKDCIFLFPEIQQQLFIPQDGFVYQIDTRHRHTFVNASKITRIHLLLSLFP